MRAYHPRDGQAWNPLREWPRNESCFCRSGKKAKKCCLPAIQVTVSIKDAEKLKQIMADRTQLHRLSIVRHVLPTKEVSIQEGPPNEAVAEIAETPGA